ncbi:MAG TPA: hypothetical protein VGS96_06980, partial [Thermoanaerobaculia bacterium]|nr:hypothetical protein [Thermoanaerobaculia bacterium]
LVPAYLVSRAFVELMSERGEPIGARRWLVYPPIVALLCVAVLLFVIGPVAPIVAWGIGEGGFHRLLPAMERIRVEAALTIASFGAWWLVASLMAAIFFRPIRFALAPLLDHMRRQYLWFVAFAGVVALIFGALLLYG